MNYLLWHLVDNQAERRPDAAAFRCEDRELTYQALAERTSRLAHVLVKAGVRPGDRVAVLLPRCLDVPVAVYGVSKAGAAFVPIDPQAPAERVAHILRDCDVTVLITSGNRRRLLRQVLEQPTQLTTVIGPDRSELDAPIELVSWLEVEAQAARNPAVPATEMDLAYLMYTSGSTGQPKGLMHTHRSGLAYAELSAATYGLEPADRVSAFAPLHVDQCTFALFSAPLAGAIAVIVPDEATVLPLELSRLIERERISVWYSVPLALTQLLERGELERFDHSALRWVTYGGEPFPPAQLRALGSHWPQARFSNVYGPAEVNQCTYHHFMPAALADDEPVPIGRAWANTQIRLVDAEDREVVDGAGELLVRSATMMAGYWRQPELEARSFVELGGVSATPARFYRTGDLVRRRADGLLEFVGRQDHQIKIRGYRVELEEVESVLCRHADVAEAAAFLLPDPAGEASLAASVRLRAAAGADAAQLRRHAARLLATAAVPAEIFLEAQLPRTAAGKIDRRALAHRHAADPGGERD